MSEVDELVRSVHDRSMHWQEDLKRLEDLAKRSADSLKREADLREWWVHASDEERQALRVRFLQQLDEDEGFRREVVRLLQQGR